MARGRVRIHRADEALRAPRARAAHGVRGAQAREDRGLAGAAVLKADGVAKPAVAIAGAIRAVTRHRVRVDDAREAVRTPAPLAALGVRLAVTQAAAAAAAHVTTAAHATAGS